MRGRNMIASCGQASRQVMQETPLSARQWSEMATTCENVGGTARSKTGSGQTVAQSAQSRHSPAMKSSDGLAATMTMMTVGQASTQAPQPLHEASPPSITPGGTILGTGCSLPPVRNVLRLMEAGFATGSTSGRSGRPEYDLPHPDEEAIAADHAYRDDRPDPEGQNKECEEFFTTHGSRRLCRSGSCVVLGHDHLMCLGREWNEQSRSFCQQVTQIGGLCKSSLTAGKNFTSHMLSSEMTFASARNVHRSSPNSLPIVISIWIYRSVTAFAANARWPSPKDWRSAVEDHGAQPAASAHCRLPRTFPLIAAVVQRARRTGPIADLELN